MTSHSSFTARTITGSGRGRLLGTPTINLDLRDVPLEFQHGIYACRVAVASRQPACRTGRSPVASTLSAVLHYGPRPVFDDSVACEVHILDERLNAKPAKITVTVVQRIRDVENFAGAEKLKEKIAEDILKSREILRGL
jgi:FAD synthase